MKLKQVKYTIGKIVYYNGNSINEYILSGCILRKRTKGQFFYQAELKDLNLNSIIIVPLEQVKITKIND